MSGALDVALESLELGSRRPPAKWIVELNPSETVLPKQKCSR